MVSSFVILNETTNDKATFGQSVKSNYIYPDDGLDWGYAQGSHSSFFYPGQVGSYITMTSVKERTVTITGYCYYVLNKEELNSITDREQRKTYAYEKIKKKKEFLNGLINPLDYIKIIIGDYYLKGKPNGSVQYGNDGYNNNEYFCLFTFSVYCNNPMFRKNEEVRTVLSGSNAFWHFPLSIPDTGFVFSTREDYLILGVENVGNVEAGGSITLEAKAVIENPTIENLTNGEKIKLNRTMQPGEKIVINTNKGIERGVSGIINGMTYNYFKYWNFDNDWIRFPKGTSLIAYTTDNQSETQLDVSIELNPEKYALENM